MPHSSIPAGRFHVSHTPEGGLVALYGVCTHLGRLPEWEPVAVRFACPCHGSQYEVDGRWITGPAPRPRPLPADHHTDRRQHPYQRRRRLAYRYHRYHP
ncbi:MAG: Rieske 2Fe-2S domain-containing protein [Chloroflexi bacterium]|nr:Rieske 2Fe-2S domain-containing protein [Chloroflexota bacterium]